MRRRQFRENRCGHRENAKLGFGAKYRHYATKCLPTEKPQELNATVVVMVRLFEPIIRKPAFNRAPNKTRQQLPIHALQAVRKPVSTRRHSEGVRNTVKTSVAYWARGMSQFSIVMRLIALHPKIPTNNKVGPEPHFQSEFRADAGRRPSPLPGRLGCRAGRNAR